MALMRRRGRVRDGDEGGGGGGAAMAGSGLLILARIVDLLVAIICVLIALGILLVVLEANMSNGLVSAVHDAAKFFVGPFDGIFSLKDKKLETAVNWGIALAVYFIVGRLIASLLRRPAA
jgi:hypothetical protein